MLTDRYPVLRETLRHLRRESRRPVPGRPGLPYWVGAALAGYAPDEDTTVTPTPATVEADAVAHPAVVSDTQTAAADSSSTPEPRPGQGRDERLNHRDLRQALAALPPATRLKLYRHPVIIASVLSDLLLRPMNLANGPVFARDLDLARDLARALDHAIDGLVVTGDRARARGLARALERDLDLAVGLARSLHRALEPVFASSRDLERDLDLAVGLARDLARGLIVGLDVDLAGALASALVSALAVGLDPIFDRARDLARYLDRLAGRLLGLPDVEGLGAALLASPLNDFTHADLSGLDLSGVDLVGVHWTLEGTRWPSEVDTDQLRNDSEETAPGSGVYVVVGRGQTVRDWVPTRA